MKHRKVSGDDARNLLSLVNDRLEIDSKTGNLIWKRKVAYRIKVGDKAGRTNSSGYIQISVGGRFYLAHRLVWLIFHGEIPDSDIDHINGDRKDNRIENLRIATRSENSQNQRRCRLDSKSGVIGVSWKSKNNKWRAQININGKVTHIGLFEDKEAAEKAYLAAKRKHHKFCTI